MSSDIIIEDPGNARILAFTAFPGTIGKPFNLRDFEQGLDQINKLATNNAKTDIKPGKTEGGSVIVVRNEPKKWLPVGLTASRDNQGSTSTGRVEDTTALTLDGPVGLNELWSFSELLTHAYTGGPHHSRAATGMLSLPLGYNTLTATVSKSSYANEVNGDSDPFMTNGITRTGSLVVDRVLDRGTDYKLSASTGITYKSIRSWVAGLFMETSSRKLTIWNTDLTGTTGLLGGTVNSDLGFSRGLHVFGAAGDSDDLETTSPRAQFNKFRYSLGWQRPFEVFEQKCNFSSQLTGQYSPTVLYGSEQISVGGTSSVRGFLDTSLAGDRGWYLQNDLSITETWEVWGETVTLKPHIGYDIGKVLSRFDSAGGTLAGIGFGVGLTVGALSFDIQHVKSVVHSYLTSHDPGMTFMKLTLSY